MCVYKGCFNDRLTVDLCSFLIRNIRKVISLNRFVWMKEGSFRLVTLQHLSVFTHLQVSVFSVFLSISALIKVIFLF
jgi:hypothetical protein